MADTEDYFPRGGKKPTVTYFKQSANFLGTAEKGERKKKKPKKRSDGDDGYLSDEAPKESYASFNNCAYGLNSKILKQGLLILGRVRQVFDTKIFISLPCRLFGTVMACHISEPYNKLLEAYVNDQAEKVRELYDMFKPGQYVAVRVLDVEDKSVMLSMMPQHVNSGVMHSDLHKGAVLQAAVVSVEDHGYVMDIGVPNMRAFLPKANTNPEVELDIGVLTWCTVKSVVPSSESSVVTLSNDLEALQQAQVRRKPSSLLPGSALEFFVDTPLDNGIEGHVFGDVTSYIQRQHADTVKGKKPALGQKIRAHVLYTLPTRNSPYLTMKNIFATSYPDLAEEQTLKDGHIVEDAQVLKITGRSIHFRLAKGCFGTMSLRRIHVDEDLSDEQVVAKSYPIGSKHKVRILCYNLADYAYSVSDEPGVLGQKYFSAEQLRPGDFVDGTVKLVADTYLLLTIGRITGYVGQVHMSDAGVFFDPKKARISKLSKKKFKVGQEVRGRVLVVDLVKQNVLVTLKPSLLAEDLAVLHDYQQPEPGQAYTGIVKFIRNDYVLVSFFNNVQAYVPRNYVTKEPIEHLADAFHLGQIVNCTILKIDAENKKMSGSLTTAPFWPNKKHEKRKHTSDSSEVPKKKQKTDKQHTEETVKDKKNKKKKNIEHDTVEDEHDAEKDTNRKESKKGKKKKSDMEEVNEKNEEDATMKRKKKKKSKETDEQTEDETQSIKKGKNKKSSLDQTNSESSESKVKDQKDSEESDAIETDFQEDSDSVLTAQDLGLIDYSDCTTLKHYKKRVVSILKFINARLRRINVIEDKIMKIEDMGLNAKNKKFHTAMHTEKLVIELRVKKLVDALKIGQAKLQELGHVPNDDYKKKKKDKSKKEDTSKNADQVPEDEVKVEKKEKRENRKLKEIKLVDSLQPVLDVPSAKDFWLATSDDLSNVVQQEDSSSSDDEQEEQPKKKRKKLTVAEKLAKVRAEEERTRELEQKAALSEAQPASTEQFQRALLANPDSSQLWIAYMAFHLQATEIDKARAVGRKALTTISFREEHEKLNVWLAMINFENRFGTKESQQKTLEEALQVNEPYKIHSKLLDIYCETGKQQELVSLVELMMRKYKRQAEVYVACGGACYRAGLLEKARQAMQKAVSVLDKKEHVSVLVQFALLERAHGAGERAEALLEQVLAVYPQRVDVAGVYLDMLLKAGDVQPVRQVMERMTSQKLPARKMKVLYNKWIEAEQKIGSPDQVESIRQRAVQYLDKAKF